MTYSNIEHSYTILGIKVVIGYMSSFKMSLIKSEAFV